MKQILKLNPYIGSAMVILITIGVSFFGYQTLRARDNADELATQSSEVLTRIDEVMLGLVNMETGLRGYLLTGNNQLLDHYHSGKSQYETSMQQLLNLTEGSPILDARWKSVEALEQQWDINWATKGIQLRQDLEAGRVSADALSSHVIAERDEAVMDAIRGQLDAGKQEETSLLVAQIQQGQQANYQAYYVMVSGMIVSLILGLITGALLNRSNIEKAKQIQLQHLLFEEREKERLQLARDLHDGPVQELLGVSFAIQELVLDNIAPAAIERLKVMKETLQTTVAELRASTMELRSPFLAKFGLRRAIGADLENFQQKYTHIKVHFLYADEAERLSEPQQAALFRIYQEAMRNIIRHSHASELTVQYQLRENAVTLSIQDNGVGFNLPEDWLTMARGGHFGLAGIRERTEAIGGHLEILTKPNEGTTVKVIIPLV